MCGIIGYTGSEDVKGVLLDALELLEYRGYDSAGIAVADTGLKQTKVYKCAGRVKDLRAICESEKLITECGIGHTRWATHGGVNDTNAHPHQVGKVTLVHNGIIENYRELIADYELESVLKSETDSEVVAALLNKFYTGDPDEAIKKTVSKLKGTFALVILFEDHQGEICQKCQPDRRNTLQRGGYACIRPDSTLPFYQPLFCCSGVSYFKTGKRCHCLKRFQWQSGGAGLS